MTSSENHSDDTNPLPDSVTIDRQTPEDVGEIFECLTSHRRRLVIDCLSEKSGPVVVEALVQHVSNQGDRRTVSTPRDDGRGEVTITLLHNHLPKMDEAGVVEVDHETKTVQKGDRFYTAASLLEVV